ncbi:MAG: tRNA lysidine(34) synthetase TilS [Magnetococcales bacterium]|nr:tRNA lysidine(34) synthetase TilS [Magnetococcales bacterium]
MAGKHFYRHDLNQLIDDSLQCLQDVRLESRLAAVIRTMVTPGEGMVVAVSGGVDSVVLLHLLLRCPGLKPDQLLLAHFDHALRPESALEAGFVQQLGQRLGVSVRIRRWPDPKAAGNIQARAREARYQFFMDAASDADMGYIVTGHHGDDQVETFFEHLLRGSGITGLRAMSWHRVLRPGLMVLRPMLAFMRAEIHAWAVQHGLEWCEDPSNRSRRYLRSRLRHELVPVINDLAADGTRRVVAACQRLQRADDALDWTLNQLVPSLELQNLAGEVSLLHGRLVQWPEELIFRLLATMSLRVTGGHHAPGSRAAAGFMHLLFSEAKSWHMRMHRLEIFRDGERIHFRKNATPARCTNKSENAYG